MTETATAEQVFWMHTASIGYDIVLKDEQVEPYSPLERLGLDYADSTGSMIVATRAVDDTEWPHWCLSVSGPDKQDVAQIFDKISTRAITEEGFDWRTWAQEAHLD